MCVCVRVCLLEYLSLIGLMRSAVETSLSEPMQTALSLVIQIRATNFQAPNKISIKHGEKLTRKKVSGVSKRVSLVSS